MSLQLWISHQKDSHFGADSNQPKLISLNETHLVIAISDLIISEGPYFNIYQNTGFKKVLGLRINASNSYNPPNKISL